MRSGAADKRYSLTVTTIMRSFDSSSNAEIMLGVKLRGQVHLEVKSDIEHAYTLAKSIKHPWYRCQALAQVADHSPPSTTHSILEESFKSAMECHDENRRVSVGCFPLEAALRHNFMDLVTVFLQGCISQISHEMDPISKWCCVDVVHIIKTNTSLLDEFYKTFVNATSQGHGWRVERDIEYLLSDPDVKKNQKYIEYLSARKNSIHEWKRDNAKTKNS
ncbi:hypothetical protein [Undibacterium sp. Ren11W]|uniref:hypothetical protein n=1 Tax=Undibacterium sp. Ren11W TaxID=3413045 RepID=UPI003BF442F9